MTGAALLPLLASAFRGPSAELKYCGGEYSVCSDGSCALTKAACGTCPAGTYVCPLSKTCLSSLDEYASCPGLNGTHFDWTLSEEQRLDALLKAVSLTEMISQVSRSAARANCRLAA